MFIISKFIISNIFRDLSKDIVDKSVPLKFSVTSTIGAIRKNTLNINHYLIIYIYIYIIFTEMRSKVLDEFYSFFLLFPKFHMPINTGCYNKIRTILFELKKKIFGVLKKKTIITT
jgi:hypothetical protein